MPKVLQKTADIMPLTQGIKLLKAASLGEELGSVIVPAVTIVCIAVICSFASPNSFSGNSLRKILLGFSVFPAYSIL